MNSGPWMEGLQNEGWTLLNGNLVHLEYARYSFQNGLSLAGAVAERGLPSVCFCLVPSSWQHPLDLRPEHAGPDAEVRIGLWNAAARMLRSAGESVVVENYLARPADRQQWSAAILTREEVYLTGPSADLASTEALLAKASSMPVFNFYALGTSNLPLAEVDESQIQSLASQVRLAACQAYDGDGAIFVPL